MMILWDGCMKNNIDNKNVIRTKAEVKLAFFMATEARNQYGKFFGYFTDQIFSVESEKTHVSFMTPCFGLEPTRYLISPQP